MRPSRNAFLGYTYQQCITFLLLVKMDVERQIDKLEIEAIVNNNFDDARISFLGESVYCQMKGIDSIKFEDLTLEENRIIIKNKPHKLSDKINVLFFKNIDCKSYNDTFLGLPAYKKDNLYIISLSRNKALQIIEDLYKYNEKREAVITHFFNQKLDKRHLIITKEELPAIDIYNIQLLEKTIDIGRKLLEFENILFIEGKPGIGKSHLVTCLTKEYNQPLVYRFWVSNQDKDYDLRLLFKNFIANISKELFGDLRRRTKDEIIQYISGIKKTVIIDGLDHVENYRPEELEYFVSFIDTLKETTKVIVLSRPLKRDIHWKKQQLVNWNFEETRLVLDELYHITDHPVCKDIFDITNGYPILVRFVAEQYKHSGQIQSLGKLESTNDYYEKIISTVNTKTALTLFITSHSYTTESEISIFLEEDLADIAKEFIKDYPYLFEIKLNRISLFHDSLNTYLLTKGTCNTKRLAKIKQIVFQSIINEEKRFISRIASFDLDKPMKVEILRKYADIDCFYRIYKDCIDFEAIRLFYNQLRHWLPELEADAFSIYTYYDLALITNILMRDQISTMNEFLYTYVQCLLFNGYSDDDITSSEYLFGMYYYYKTKDPILLYNITTEQHYDTNNFYQKLEYEVWAEDNYFNRHLKPVEKKRLKGFLSKEWINIDTLEYIPHLLANIYIHNTEINELKDFYQAVCLYIHKNENQGIKNLEKALSPFKSVNADLSPYYLAKAKDIILSLGTDTLPNEYLTHTLRELILKYTPEGSFNVWPKVLNYIRLSLHQNKKIDLANITSFFAMYQQRKDMTVINLPEALKIYEDKGFITIEKALDIIVFTQSMSEKGIRHLLREYLELHQPDIISIVLKKYHPAQLHITWFDLPAEHINCFPDELFEYALNQQLFYWNSYSKEVKFDEIKNLFLSDRKQELVNLLKFFKYRITIEKHNPYLKELQALKCSLSLNDSTENNKNIRSSEERFNQGILDADSIDFIKENKLNITDIAGYTDGYYSVFSDINIFKIYPKDQVKENVLLILRNALIGRIKTIDEFACLFYFVGNLPKFMDEYDITVEYKKLYDSFMKFLKISSLERIAR